MSGFDLSTYRVITLAGEKFQRAERLHEIMNAVVDNTTRDFNLDVFSAETLRKNDDIGAVAELIMTFPMMAPRRVIVLKDFDAIPQALRKKLSAIIKDTPDTTLVLIEGEKVTLAPKPPKQFLHAESFKVIYENQLPGWVRSRFTMRDKKVTGEAVALLINNAGMVLGELDNEIEKISVVAGDRDTITDRIVEAVVGKYRRDTVWNLCNAVGTGNFRGAAQILHVLMQSEKNKEFLYVATLTAHIMKIGAYQNARHRGIQHKDAMALVTNSPFLWKLNRMDEQVRNYTPSKLRSSLTALSDAESSIKNVGMDNKLIMQLLLPRIIPDITPR